MSVSTRKKTGPALPALDAPLLENPVLHRLIMAAFSDCRKFYPNRAMFDKDYVLVKRCTLNQLHQAWKAVNASLCEGDVADTKWLRWRPADPQGIRAIRQLVGFLSRLEGLCDDTVAIEAWRHRVANSRARVRDPAVLAAARQITARLLGPAPSIWELNPKHGSGSVATGEKQWDKWCFTTTYRQLEQLVGGRPDRPTPLSADLFYGNASIWASSRKACVIEKHPITKVVSVPKDLVKPRIISEEPLSLMFLQQGLMRWLYTRIERATEAINFSDQTVNALTCKEHLYWASLDLSDASDLVSRTIVKQLMPNDWWRLLSALRSHFARTPDGVITPLRCFTPMGNALCFPVEAIVFYATVSAYLSVNWSISDVYVYGDDILVPTAYAEDVLSFLMEIGMKPNVHKCCYRSKFRESCGAEWFDGHDVTVVRPRSISPSRYSIRDDRSPGASGILPLVDTANRLYNMGFPNTAQLVADLVHLPVHPGHGPMSANPHLRWKNVGVTRWNPSFQRYQRRIACFGPPRKVESPDGWLSLNAWLTAGWSSRCATSAVPVLKYIWFGI
jgi:hypothetical protein